MSLPRAATLPPLRPRRRFATFRTVTALILREMSSRYGRTPGGYVWAILEPLGVIAILSIGFSLLIRNPSLGSSFLLFYASGYLPFSLYQSVQNVVARALTYSKPLLVYPAVSWTDAILARFLLNTLTGVIVTYVLLTGIIAATETNVVLDVPVIVEAIALSALLGLGVGAINCALMGLMPTWDVIWSIASRPLFIASGVFFIYEDLGGIAQDILWWNPLMHVTGILRSGIYPMYDPTYVSTAYVLGFALITLAFGLLLLRRYHKDILNQ
jgi:capsular polysaccharide transport system permease protein